MNKDKAPERSSPVRAEGGGPLLVRTPDGPGTLLDPSRLVRAVAAPSPWVAGDDGGASLRQEIFEVSDGLVPREEAEGFHRDVIASLRPDMSRDEVDEAKILAARARIEFEPGFALVAARLLLDRIYSEVSGVRTCRKAFDYPGSFLTFLTRGVETGRLDRRLQEFDLDAICRALRPERDLAFRYMGLRILYDRYLIHDEERRIEAPQHFWMRVAMGLALGETGDRTGRAVAFYELLSTFRYCPSTPTLFNSGTAFPQMSSCFLTTVPDDLDGIFKAVHANAMLSKWSGGLGNDWTPVRALGAHIHGTNGASQGVIPFLSVANATAVAVNQGGKRKGAVCAYLEIWHKDVLDFLELRRNTGDERRRAHDMNTAVWVPDLFMKRVLEDGEWTLFSPDEVPDLHDLYGRAFEERYAEAEGLARSGRIRNAKSLRAQDLWRRLLSMLFETGHPWITFKDPCNVRSPQDHAGVVHSSNLCTEITLNTGPDEIAVCNLGSVNLAEHVGEGGLDLALLEDTVRGAMRMLDNVIDLNLYPVAEAGRANRRHRPVGLGIMGFQDALYRLDTSYASDAAVTFADRCMEAVSYFAIRASAELAAERGPYPSYRGSKWDRGLLPVDTVRLLREERGGFLTMDERTTMDWGPVRDAIRTHGMRNANCLALAPTATIANIVGVSESIAPTYRNLYTKANLSGDFTVVNEHLVRDLRKRGLWDRAMLDDLKYFDGSVQDIARVPDDLREKYRVAFEIDPSWLIRAASARQKWIDQSQSLNLYMAEPNGRKLSDMYILAWESGLKTTYYLRTLAATQVEKATIDVNARGIQPRWMRARSASADIRPERLPLGELPACRVDDPGCEACQ